MVRHYQRYDADCLHAARSHPRNGRETCHRRRLSSLYKIESHLRRCHSVHRQDLELIVDSSSPVVKMNPCTILFAALLCCSAIYAQAEVSGLREDQGQMLAAADDDGLEHARPKRTLFLKKKLLGAGLLGFGLGVAKGYKAGYHHGPEVHHVYVAPPPSAVKYVEYVEKPVYVERIVERPVFKPSPEYDPSWSSPSEPLTSYGSW